MKNLRILSLLPAATEMVYLLGLDKYLVGVSHECDYPPQAKLKPKVTLSVVSNSMTSRQIDNQVKLSLHRGPGVFHIREGVLKKLKPNLILTQELCKLCAVGFDQVQKSARILGSNPSVILRSGATKDLLRMQVESRTSLEIPRYTRNDNKVTIISLEPESVEDILANILLVGESSGKSLESRKIVKKLKSRILKLDSRLSTLETTPKPKVLVIEWLDPIMVAGHWVPEMVGLAGGKNLLTKREERSKIVTIDQIVAAEPDILIISPCGFDIQRTSKEIDLIERIIRDVGSLREAREVKVYLVDGNSFMTRPGPRIVDGIEILAEILHPEHFSRKYSQKDWQEFMV